MTARSQKGYTLVELLICIAVVAICAAILFPVFSNAKINAAKKTDRHNTRKIAAAILMYADDNDDQFPRVGFDCRGFASGEHNQCGGDGWQDAIGPYVRNASTFLAPDDHSAVGDGPWGGGTGNDFNATDGNLSFLMNDMLAHKQLAKNGYADLKRTDPRSDGLNVLEVKNPAECLLLAEGHSGWNKAGAPDDPSAYVATDWTGSTNVQNKWHHAYDLSQNFTPFMSAAAYD